VPSHYAVAVLQYRHISAYQREFSVMSKHSHWAKVKRAKGAADVKKAAQFTRLARAVTVAAREGGGDPNFNFKLRTAVDNALAQSMPKDNVERAIKKGIGGEDAVKIETIMYEGFGPSGVAVMVEVMTDNRNRTSSNMKHHFSVHGGNMGGTGAVQWMFEKKGIVRLASEAPLGDEQEMALIDAGAEDIENAEGEVIVTTAPDAFLKLKQAAEKAGLKVVYAGTEWQPKEQVSLEGEAQEKVEALLEALDEDEDVNEVYSNLA